MSLYATANIANVSGNVLNFIVPNFTVLCPAFVILHYTCLYALDSAGLKVLQLLDVGTHARTLLHFFQPRRLYLKDHLKKGSEFETMVL